MIDGLVRWGLFASSSPREVSTWATPSLSRRRRAGILKRGRAEPSNSAKADIVVDGSGCGCGGDGGCGGGGGGGSDEARKCEGGVVEEKKLAALTLGKPPTELTRACSRSAERDASRADCLTRCGDPERVDVCSGKAGFGRPGERDKGGVLAGGGAARRAPCVGSGWGMRTGLPVVGGRNDESGDAESREGSGEVGSGELDTVSLRVRKKAE